MLIDFLKGVKRIAQQNKPKPMLETGNLSFVNWWKEDPAEDWFTRFIRYHFPDCNVPIRFYSVFGSESKLKDNFEGIRIFYSGENLENHYQHKGMIRRQSVELYWKYRGHHYGNYALDKVDLALGMSRTITDAKYLCFPEWITYIVEPEFDKEDIRNKVKEINEARPHPNAEGAVLLASHDDYGTRERICRDVEKLVPITYAGRWRNNSTELWEKYGDDKREYLRNFRFNICPENVDAAGYCTEKIFDAFLSGAIPIYHGDRNDPEAGLINKDAVIFWNYDGDNAEQMEKLKRLKDDENYYQEFMQQPKLTDETVTYVYDKTQELKQRIEILLSRTGSEKCSVENNK